MLMKMEYKQYALYRITSDVFINEQFIVASDKADAITSLIQRYNIETIKDLHIEMITDPVMISKKSLENLARLSKNT